MTTLALQCNHCGAPLKASGSVQFITCAHCGSALVIKQQDGAAWTELSERLEQSHEALSKEVELLKLQNDLDRLDREWSLGLERYRIHTKHGSRLPDQMGAMVVIMPVIGVVFGVFWMTVASSMGAPSVFPLFGLVFIGVAIFGGFSMSSKLKRYQSHQRRYKLERVRLVRAIEQARS